VESLEPLCELMLPVVPDPLVLLEPLPAVPLVLPDCEVPFPVCEPPDPDPDWLPPVVELPVAPPVLPAPALPPPDPPVPPVCAITNGDRDAAKAIANTFFMKLSDSFENLVLFSQSRRFLMLSKLSKISSEHGKFSAKCLP
jgi:hypothetical protein